MEHKKPTSPIPDISFTYHFLLVTWALMTFRWIWKEEEQGTRHDGFVIIGITAWLVTAIGVAASFTHHWAGVFLVIPILFTVIGMAMDLYEAFITTGMWLRSIFTMKKVEKAPSYDAFKKGMWIWEDCYGHRWEAQGRFSIRIEA